MEDSVSIRLLAPGELGQLLELYRELHPEDPDVTESPALGPLWEDICRDPDMAIVVAEADGLIVSSCTLAIIKNLTRGLRPYAVVENVITRPRYRNRGYGTLVLQKAIGLARERGCYKVMLLSGSKQEETLQFYENAGFRRGMKTGFIVELCESPR